MSLIRARERTEGKGGYGDLATWQPVSGLAFCYFVRIFALNSHWNVQKPQLGAINSNFVAPGRQFLAEKGVKPNWNVVESPQEERLIEFLGMQGER